MPVPLELTSAAVVAASRRGKHDGLAQVIAGSVSERHNPSCAGQHAPPTSRPRKRIIVDPWKRRVARFLADEVVVSYGWSSRGCPTQDIPVLMMVRTPRDVV